MIVRCLSYGSLWWLRPGTETADAGRYSTRAAIFNTTGFRSGSRERRNWTVAGVLRLNAGTCIDQHLDLNDIEPGNFVTAGIEHRGSQNRLLLERRVKNSAVADIALVAVRSSELGRISFADNWRSAGVKIVSASAHNGEQETLLVMPDAGEVITDQGTWRLDWNTQTTSQACWTPMPARAR